MPTGRLVDFCISYNERQEKAEKEAEKESKKQEQKQKKRKGTQADIDAFFG